MKLPNLHWTATLIVLMTVAPSTPVWGQGEVNAAPSAARLQIERAWEERSRRIRSVELRTDIQELVKGRGDRPLDPADDPFGERLPKEDRMLGRVGYYAFEDGKIAIASF